MDTFSRLHPLTILIYYITAVFLMILYGHPELSLLIWLVSLAYYACLAGAGKGIRFLFASLGAAVLCLVINPILNHRGVTLWFMLGGMRITKEAVLYGVNMALILLASLLLFACFSYVMTAEKIMTLMGKRLPAFSLLFSMILRFVPKAGKDFREMSALHGNRPAVWPALIGISLEDALERSLSMKGRGYGRGERTSYYQKKLAATDGVVLGVTLIVLVVLCLTYWCEDVKVRFFPSIRIDMLGAGTWITMSVFYSIPLLMRGKEEIAWRLSRRKITDFTTRSNPNQHFESMN